MNYITDLKAFQKHMSDAVNRFFDNQDNEEIIEHFYNSDFTISFMGKTVTLYNGADVFQAIEDIIEQEIEDMGEI